MQHLKNLIRCMLVVLAMVLPTVGSPSIASAQDQEEIYENADGRLRGYEASGVMLEEQSIALTYLALIALAALAIGVTFKSARRSHLD
jgi:hypothetical protein